MGKRYETYVSHWTGTAWSQEQEINEGSMGRQSDEISSRATPEIPEFISIPDFATHKDHTTIHFRLHGKGKTVRLK